MPPKRSKRVLAEVAWPVTVSTITSGFTVAPALVVVTSPPYYGQRDYGTDDQIGHEEHPSEFIEKLVEVFDLDQSEGPLVVVVGETPKSVFWTLPMAGLLLLCFLFNLWYLAQALRRPAGSDEASGTA